MDSNEVPAGYMRIPGLPGVYRDRSQDEAPAAPVKPTKPTMTSYGIPAGRYAVTLPDGPADQFFWFKIGPAPMFSTSVQWLDPHTQKWRAYYGGIRTVAAAIKADGWDAADRYGVLRRACALCGKPLTVSALKGVGPECEARLGETFTEG